MLNIKNLTFLETTPDTWRFSKELNLKLKNHPEYVKDTVEFICGLDNGNFIVNISPIEQTLSIDELLRYEALAKRVYSEYVDTLLAETNNPSSH